MGNDEVRDTLEAMHSAIRGLKELIDPLVDGAASLTPKRAVGVAEAFVFLENAKGAYDQALRDAGWSPPHRS